MFTISTLQADNIIINGSSNKEFTDLKLPMAHYWLMIEWPMFLTQADLGGTHTVLWWPFLDSLQAQP